MKLLHTRLTCNQKLKNFKHPLSQVWYRHRFVVNLKWNYFLRSYRYKIRAVTRLSSLNLFNLFSPNISCKRISRMLVNFQRRKLLDLLAPRFLNSCAMYINTHIYVYNAIVFKMPTVVEKENTDTPNKKQRCVKKMYDWY